MNDPNAHKIVFVTVPISLTEQQLLFTVDIGARYAAHGSTREEDLRTYIKRVSIEANDRTSMLGMEQEMEALHRRQDRPGLQALNDRISALEKSTDAVWRLQAKISHYLMQPKREEHYLKKMLASNPQNLWAANSLGRLYIRQHRVSEGVEVLKKLSLFHELNSERNYTIGNAYLNSGNLKEARTEFEKSDRLASGSDIRFKEGLAKVEFAEGNSKAALDLLGDRALSSDVLSFLNMRAIMAIRSGKFDEGFKQYEQAVKGCDKADEVMLARLKFNYGLAFVRAKDHDKAAKLFEESVKLGGSKFKRAAKPLEITKAALKSNQKSKTGDAIKYEPIDDMLDLEYESLD